ncbi:MAG: hypothetical protein WD077_04745 [Bacteroidia bacterium]
MQKQLIIPFFLLVLITSLSGCRKPSCPHTAQPLVIFNFFITDTSGEQLPVYHFFDRAYAVGGKGDLIPKLNKYELPVNINADSMVVIFESGGNQDTIQLNYIREEVFQGHDGTCGFHINIMNMKITSSTFPDTYRNGSESEDNLEIINILL